MSPTSSSTPRSAPEAELTPAQIQQTEALANQEFGGLLRGIRRRSHATYAVCAPHILHNCLSNHLDVVQTQDMIEAEVFHCPVCGNLLKDRRTKIATAIMLERQRLKELWQGVEDHIGDPDFHLHLDRFRAALGLAVTGGSTS
jgi:hypothetical protein